MDAHHDPASGLLRRAAGTDPPADAGRTPAAGDGQTCTDTLSDVLQAIRLTSALFFLVDAGTPWVAEAPNASVLATAILPRAQHVVSYHVLLRGVCWCEMPGRAPVRLEGGDVVVIPHGDAYALSSEPTPRAGLPTRETLEWFRRMAAGRLPPVVEEGGAGPERIGVVCSFLACDALPFNPVLATLPRLLHVRPPRHGRADRVNSLIEFAVAESREKGAGSRSVLLRIGELMFVEVVRRYLAALPEGEGGWLAGLRDPIVGRALSRMHQQPSRSWTLDELAREAASSRSVLTERFTALIGQPPMRYLASWRLQLAAGLLAADGAKVHAVAREVGYESEAAFSRAFKKLTGVAPAAWRRRGSA